MMPLINFVGLVKKTQSVCSMGVFYHARGDNRELLGAADGRE
jgi:hypothetical protein